MADISAILVGIADMRKRLDGMEKQLRDFPQASESPTQEPDHRRSEEGINSIPVDANKKRKNPMHLDGKKKMMVAFIKRNMSK